MTSATMSPYADVIPFGTVALALQETEEAKSNVLKYEVWRATDDSSENLADSIVGICIDLINV